MLIFLIGHRGVGKTGLLKRIARYVPESVTICLDSEIERKHGDIKKIFAANGVEYFRKLENDTLQDLLLRLDTKKKIYIALGAGFSGSFPEGCRKIWVRRDMDPSHFLFLDRPTLNGDPRDLKMPPDLFVQRERNFANICTEQITLKEGIYDFDPAEALFFQHQISHVGAALTLLSGDFEKETFLDWIQRRDDWGLHSFELRNDLLSQEQIRKVVRLSLKTPLLFSFRSRDQVEAHIRLAEQCAYVDWDHNLGEMPEAITAKAFISVHSSLEEFQDNLVYWQDTVQKIKWAPVVETLEQLYLGHQWVLADPKRRAFLPRSLDGRWQWYRLLMKNKMMLSFLREGTGSAQDQPSLLNWLTTEPFANSAAVIGSPVMHSWSPTFHNGFFREHSCNFFALTIDREEDKEKTLETLFRLGFRALAVTSPLKEWAGGVSGCNHPVNTLVWSTKDDTWIGKSTDLKGFQLLLQEENITLEVEKVAVWGSGAMSELLKNAYPAVEVFSARTGEGREGYDSHWSPALFIWSAGDNPSEALVRLYPHWQPKIVIDMSYRQDSPAISFAYRWGARYISGVKMFIGQGYEQQIFWKQYLNPSHK
ncbi:MAG: hypothetical protein H6623_04290 [Bdellovibrionaceae bacterium]|nr:hypothetical protein [Pseudobdellovibrionaceae bacterium]